MLPQVTTCDVMDLNSQTHSLNFLESSFVSEFKRRFKTYAHFYTQNKIRYLKVCFNCFCPYNESMDIKTLGNCMLVNVGLGLI